MKFAHYSDEPVELAVDLVNTLEVVAGEEQLRTPEDVAEFLATHAGEWYAPERKLTDRDLHEVRALRSRLRDAFQAGDAAAAAEVLNGILADVVATPRISVHGESPHLHFEPEEGSPARWLGSITAMGLGIALVEGGFERFGRCVSTTCDDVFVDISRNRSKRHCSDTCTTREAVAAHRKRQSHPA